MVLKSMGFGGPWRTSLSSPSLSVLICKMWKIPAFGTEL